MKFVEMKEIGNPPDVLKLESVPTPAVGRGEARVRVLATPIHPSNLLAISGKYMTVPPVPSIPGSEGIGQVEETGEGVDRLKIGQRVMLLSGSTWCDEMVASATSFAPLPDEGDTEQLSMLSVNPMTALMLLRDYAELRPGDWVVQSAANSAVGEYVVQMAKARGLRTINIVRRESLAAGLKALGADEVVLDAPDLANRIARAAGGDPVRLAIDCVGGETLTAMAESMSAGGTLVAYGALSGRAAELNSGLLINKDLRIRGFWLSRWYQTASAEEKLAALGEIIPMVVSGAIKARIESRFDLEQIADAVKRAAEPGREGKVLIVPGHA